VLGEVALIILREHEHVVADRVAAPALVRLLALAPALDVLFSGLSITPPEVPATKKKWFGKDGPATEAKK